MIPFFRKIRKQLADDNKPIKYLRYAIGEIVLVVIGILIALQINNANENRKNEEKLISIFNEIQRELGHNINEATESITYYKKKDSLISLVLQKKVTKKNYLNDLNLGFLLFNLRVTEIRDNSYSILNNNLNIVPINYKPLMEKLNTVFERNKSYVENQQNLNINFMENYRSSISESKEWYSGFAFSGNQNNVVLDYFLKNPLYINKVTELRIGIQNLYLSRFKINSVEAYKALAEITGKYDDISPEIYFQKTVDLLKYEGKFIVNEPSEYYIAEDGSNELIFRIDGNKIFMKIFGTQEHELFPHTKNTFILNDGDNTQIIFNKNKKGKIYGLSLFNNNDFTDWIKVE